MAVPSEPSTPGRTNPAVDPSVVLQREYYARTANDYDTMHDAVEHDLALGHIIGFVNWLGARTLLDTGCGTGRGMRVVSQALPGLEVHGNDPSQELLDVAVARYGVPAARLDNADTESLPYDDEAFDVVMATGVLHHVPHPDRIVGEMLRVARQAVFISDNNLYGYGSLLSRFAKSMLAAAGLLRWVNRVRRGGHDWFYSEGDGVAWSYSVYDSLGQVRRQCAEVLVIPTDPRDPRATANPRLWSSHALLCGFKTPLPRPSVTR